MYGPPGDHGYFKPLFDKRTGEIDPDGATYWRENYDLLHYMKTNWSSLCPKISGKLHVYCGDMDTYYLNVAVKEMQEWIRLTENPHYPGVSSGATVPGIGSVASSLRKRSEFGAWRSMCCRTGPTARRIRGGSFDLRPSLRAALSSE